MLVQMRADYIAHVAEERYDPKVTAKYAEWTLESNENESIRVMGELANLAVDLGGKKALVLLNKRDLELLGLYQDKGYSGSGPRPAPNLAQVIE